VASSDATNIQLSIRREGDGYVLNGRKCGSPGGFRAVPVFIVMGKTDPTPTGTGSSRWFSCHGTRPV